MPVDRATALLLDASCLIAAAGSSRGGSAFLLMLCEQGLLAGTVSPAILAEAERNVALKLPAALARLRNLLASARLTLVSPTPASAAPFVDLVGEKDAHVLAAAQMGRVDYLITLDKRLCAAVNGASVTVVALSPGEFIQSVLPAHPDYHRLR